MLFPPLIDTVEIPTPLFVLFSAEMGKLLDCYAVVSVDY